MSQKEFQRFQLQLTRLSRTMVVFVMCVAYYTTLGRVQEHVISKLVSVPPLARHPQLVIESERNHLSTYLKACPTISVKCFLNNWISNFLGQPECMVIKPINPPTHTHTQSSWQERETSIPRFFRAGRSKMSYLSLNNQLRTRI